MSAPTPEQDAYIRTNFGVDPSQYASGVTVSAAPMSLDVVAKCEAFLNQHNLVARISLAHGGIGFDVFLDDRPITQAELVARLTGEFPELEGTQDELIRFVDDRWQQAWGDALAAQGATEARSNGTAF